MGRRNSIALRRDRRSLQSVEPPTGYVASNPVAAMGELRNWSVRSWSFTSRLVFLLPQGGSVGVDACIEALGCVAHFPSRLRMLKGARQDCRCPSLASRPEQPADFQPALGGFSVHLLHQLHGLMQALPLFALLGVKLQLDRLAPI